MNDAERRTIEGWIEKASNHLQVAREHAKSHYRSSEAIQAAQECTELSVKAVLSFLSIEYPLKHEWDPEKKPFAAIARQIRERCLLDGLAGQDLSDSVPLPRLLMLLNFWGQFHLIAKYGFEPERLAAAQDLFRPDEAKLAVQHAEECYRAASAIRYHDREKLAMLQGRASGPTT